MLLKLFNCARNVKHLGGYSYLGTYNLNRYYSDSPKSVRIGCASGFWGDTATAAPQLIQHGNIDYLVFDYLSEITMSLLTAAQSKDPNMGYAPDFLQAVMNPFLKGIKKNGIRVVSNAGGINPEACAAALSELSKKQGIDLKVATITGDNILHKKEQLKSAGIKEMFSNATFPDGVNSMTAYLGAGPIKVALDEGADIVITGRCTDSALVLGPLMHSFGWTEDSYDLLASGSLAGHLIECGAQVTGGIFTDWHKVPDWHNIGFPIVECQADGKFIVTKPEKTGGMVTPATCAEQLVYEIGDPKRYILPDVVCDFSNVKFEQVEGKENAVHVTGANGTIPSSNYKVCSTYLDGYRINAVFVIGGPKSAEKGKKTVEAIIKRVRNIFKMLKMDDFRRLHVQMLGNEDTYGDHACSGDGPREIVAWLSAHHNDKRALQLLAREIAPAGTGMAPGLTGIAGGRPKVSPILKLFSFLHPKSDFNINITNDNKTMTYIPSVGSDEATLENNDVNENSIELERGTRTYRLEELAYTRSGDKGNNCNIGVIAREARFVPYIRAMLTADAVDGYMSHVFENRSGPVAERVTRYELPGINGFNFVLHNSLGGGGVASLRSDPQGKAFGQMLLDFELKNMPNFDV